MLGILACAAAWGCSKDASQTTSAPQVAKTSTPKDPDRAMYDKIRSGTYQISSAIDTLEDVRRTVRGLSQRETGNTQQAMANIVTKLDSAGKDLADFGGEVPSFDEFKKTFATQDDRRLKAIDGANLAIEAIEDAQLLLEKLLDSHPPEPEHTLLENADSALEGSNQALDDAIKTMGGKVAVDNDN